MNLNQLTEQYQQGLITRTEYICAMPSTSSWLKQAISALERRDPVDALYDVKLLLTICEEKLKRMGIRSESGST